MTFGYHFSVSRALDNFDEFLTISQACEVLSISNFQIKKFIKVGLIQTTSQAKPIQISQEQVLSFSKLPEYTKILEKLYQKREKRRQEPYYPDSLRDYHKFHRFLNEFTWLIKVYHSPREIVSSGNFRLDT